MTQDWGELGRIEQIAILGVGLLGGSIGLRLKAMGFPGRVLGYSRRDTTLAAALATGCVDEVTRDLPAAIRSSQLAVLCAPVGVFPTLFQAIADHDHPDLMLTDVGSTKAQVCADARRILPDPGRFIACHPMAGGELHGPTHARADLFEGKPCVISLEEGDHPAARRTVEALWRALGMRLIYMGAQAADDTVARISHLPHAVAVALVELASRLGGLDVASTGFRDTSRVASGDPQIWVDIFASNRAATLVAIDQFIDELSRFRSILEQGDDQAMFHLLTHAQQARDAWLAGRPELAPPARPDAVTSDTAHDIDDTAPPA